MNINATILGQAIAFVLFVAFCMRYVWPQIIDAIEKRQKEISDSFSFIENEKKNLAYEKSNMVTKLKTVKHDAKTIIEEAKKIRLQILEDAKITAENERNIIVAQAEKEIALEYIRVREELRKEISLVILAVAEKIIERSVDKTTNVELINKLVTEML